MTLRKGQLVKAYMGLAKVISSPNKGSVLIEYVKGEWKNKQARCPVDSLEPIKEDKQNEGTQVSTERSTE